MTAERASRIVVIGREGQLARALADVLPGPGIEVIRLGRPGLDLMDAAGAARQIRDAAPNLVVNAAAYTAVDKAEDDPETAYAVNAVAPGAMAAAACDAGAPFVHISTDYVFDGSKHEPYLEEDPVGPLGVYGASKLAGEAAVRLSNPRHVILRTAWVCSPYGANFLKTMLRLAAERPMLRVVDDQYGAPAFAADLARAIAAIHARLASATPTGGEHFGIFHLSSEGTTSWAGFAKAIMASSARRGGPSVPVEPIPTSAYPTRARRPAYSKLSNAKIGRVYDIRMPAWEDSLERCLDELLGSQSGQEQNEGARR